MSLIKLFKFIIKYLKFKIYYFKYYYRFIFAHKPLCEKFKNDTLLLFHKLYVCRSCFYLYMGLFVTLLISFYCLMPNIINKNIILISSFIFTVLLFSKPSFYKNYSRLQRDVLRCSTGISMGLTLIILCKVNLQMGLFLLTALFIAKKIYSRERNIIDVCDCCNELSAGKTCSGYKKQIEALLILEENYSKTLNIRKELLND